jgi:hypothetical protein
MAGLQLVFLMPSGTLYILDGDKTTRIMAFSGGRGGSKLKGAVDEIVVNNWFFMCQKLDHAKNVDGGPLPLGRYIVHTPTKHKRLGLSAYLQPSVLAKEIGEVCNRDGFFIHGRGKRGSDGCIVPEKAAEFQSLMSTLTARKGGELIVVIDGVKMPF